MTISEKAAYLKGLADGLDYNRESPEGKLIAALIDLTSELATAIDEIDTAIDEIDNDLEELNDYIEEVDEDLGEVEEYLCDIDCDCDCDCDDFDDEDEDDDDDECADCSGCDGCSGIDEEAFRMMMCPFCNEEIYFDESIDPSELSCPACGKAVCSDEVEELD